MEEENNKIPYVEDSSATDELPQKVQEEPQQIAQPAYIPRKGIDTAERKPSFMEKLRRFGVECKRVLRVTKKPDRVEFKTIVKISGIGMIVIGLLGFLVHFGKELIF